MIDTLFDGALIDSDIRIVLTPYATAMNADSLANIVSTLPSSPDANKAAKLKQALKSDKIGNLCFAG